jgi:PAS domain S-box-containing protein
MQKDAVCFKILVIEDNPGDFALIEDYLREMIESPLIRQAKTYRDANEQLCIPSMRCDVILLDLTLPDKSGTALITEILSQCPDVPVIVLTGYSDVSFGIKSLSLGVADYLLKDELSPSLLYKSIIYSIERKKTLLRLEESERRYSDLFHLSPQPMWVYDDESLRFLYVNTAAINHYGYSKEEFLTMTIKDIRPEEDVYKMEETIKYTKQHVVDYFHGTFRHKKKNGEIIYVDIQSNLMQYEGRNAKLILAIDVTENFTHMAAIEKQNKKLREIAWIQSHVVRAPVARMMGIANLVKDLKSTTEEGARLLEYMVSSCNELDVIIRDIANKSNLININEEAES